MKRASAIALCFLTLPLLADAAPSGFLSDYERLDKKGPIRERYLAYVAPGAADAAATAVYVAPVVRYPATAQFGELDDAFVSSVLFYTEQQLRLQLAVFTRVVDEPSAADVSLNVALTALGAQVEGKTPLDLVPLRLVTGAVKNVAMGKMLDATALFEMRVSRADSGEILRESLHALVGEAIGRDDSENTHMTLEALKPAIDKWVALVVKQVAAKS